MDKFLHPDAEIAALILPRRGRENAISVEEIGRALWLDDWTLGGPEGERNRKNLADRIKKAVGRLVRLDGAMIVSSRGKVHGYFMPTSKREIDRAARPLVRQAVKMLKRAEALTGNTRYGEMAGQLNFGF